MASAENFIEKKIKSKKAVLFAKSNEPWSKKVICMLSLLNDLLTPDVFDIVNIEKRSDCSEFQDALWKRARASRRVIPILFVKGKFFGDFDTLLSLYQQETLRQELCKHLENRKLTIMEDVIVTIKPLEFTEVEVQLCELEYVDERFHEPAKPVESCVGEEPLPKPWMLPSLHKFPPAEPIQPDESVPISLTPSEEIAIIKEQERLIYEALPIYYS